MLKLNLFASLFILLVYWIVGQTFIDSLMITLFIVLLADLLVYITHHESII